MIDRRIRKVILLTSYDVDEPRAWSSVPFSFCKALRSLVANVQVLSPLQPVGTAESSAKLARYTTRQLWYTPMRDPAISRQKAIHCRSFLELHRDADLIIVLHPPDASYLQVAIPIVVVHDATWKQFTAEYPSMLGRPLALETFLGGYFLEYKAFINATHIVMFTRWAERAVPWWWKHKTCTVLPGANIDGKQAADLTTRAEDKLNQPPRLLFVGRDTYRKGLDRALRIFEAVRRRIPDSSLTVVGASRDQAERLGSEVISQANICYYESLRSGDRHEVQVLAKLYSEATFLVVPSRAECSSLAICDAACYGVPSVTEMVGGNEELLFNRTSGVLLQRNASAEEYALAITETFYDAARYMNLSRESRRRYETDLNWVAHVRAILEMVARASNSLGAVGKRNRQWKR